MATRRVSDSQQPPRKALPPEAQPRTGAEPAAAAKPRKRRATAKKEQAVIASSAVPTVSEDQRRGMIALSAYLRAERRGFSPEGQAEDWLAAEKEVDALLNSGQSAPQ
jgi:Protein of unknown function (DUF2934)